MGEDAGTSTRQRSWFRLYSSTISASVRCLSAEPSLFFLLPESILLNGISSSVPAARHITPVGRNENMVSVFPLNSSHASAITRFGGVPIKVSIPPILEAKASGIRKRDAEAPAPAAMETTMGSISATVPVLLTNPPIRPVARTTTRNRRVGLPLPRRDSRAPIIFASPVLKMAPPTINSPTIMMTIGFENPDRASCVVRMPVRVSTSKAIRAMISARILPHTKPAAASTRVTRVMSMGYNIFRKQK